METLLLIDDDKVLRQTLKENLEHHDFIVIEASVCKRMIEIVKKHKVGLILLDLQLPDGYGLDFIKEIKEYTNVPIIIISGEQDNKSKIDGLNLGADDFLTKPFSIEELVARIQANLRCYNCIPANEQNNSSGKPTNIVFNNWRIDCDQHQIFDNKNNSGNLTFQEFVLLNELSKNAGQVVNREVLCEALSEDNYKPTHRAIDIKISRIRKKIGDDGQQPKIIKTVRNVGYILNAEKS